VPEGINVAVFEPGFMPGTGLSRQHGPEVQRMGRGMQRLPLPGIASPVKSGPALASVILDERWAHLRDGDFVVIDKERDVMPIANDPGRERRLWEPAALTSGTAIMFPEEGPHAGKGVVERMAVIGQQITHAEETVTARPALASEAERLDMRPGGIVLTIARVYRTDERAVETADIVLPAERYAVAYDVPVR
jgi:hypothetical protein